METLKTLINLRFKTLILIISTLVFSLVLLMIRIKLNKTFFYVFLVWNMFLAIIPYVITMYLSSIKLNRLKLIFGFIIWLAFLPNAPYIVTDLLHLRVSNTSLLWLDILVILSFALSGLFLFYLSLSDMHRLINIHFKKLPKQTFILGTVFLCGFGIYLGRFLRYNSWHIISQPKDLISDILNIIIYPHGNIEVWLFTFGFSSFLLVGYWVFKNLHSTPST